VSIFRILLSAQGGEGGSSSDDDKGKKFDPEAAFQKLLDKNSNDGLALARLLWEENREYRQKNSDLKSKLPSDGSLVLSAEDAKAWSGYQALGPLDTVRKAVKDGAVAISENQGFKRKEVVAEIGKKAGVPVDKLDALLGLDKPHLVYETTTKKVNGKDVEVVTVKDGDKEPVEFDAHFKDYLPAIKPTASDQQPPKPTSQGTPRRNGMNGRPFTTPAEIRQQIVDGDNPEHVRASIRASGIGSF